MKTSRWIGLLVSGLAVTACATDSGLDIEDGENDAAGGKSDSIADGSNESRAVLQLVNDGDIEVVDLDVDAGLSTRVAKAIIAHRKGPDNRDGTSDDDYFDDLDELDAIPYVGSATMQTLLGHAIELRATYPTLTVDLVGRENTGNANWIKVPLDTLNDVLPSGPDFGKKITLGANDGEQFSALLAQLEKINAKLDRFIQLEQDWDPSEYTNLCYTGDVRKIAKTVDALRGSMFSVYMGVQGEKYGTTKKIYMGNEAEWLASYIDDNASSVAMWKNFNTRSKNYLMITDGGQQGDGSEFFATLIKPCQ